MGKVIGVTNQKGGVGKTTTAVNLACGLGYFGKKVLLIDTDPQHNATSAVGYEPEDGSKSIAEVFANEVSLEDVIVKNVKPNLDICPGSLNLGKLLEFMNGETPIDGDILKRQIGKVKDDYDFIIIDTPPSLGLINKNCLAAADTVLIPVQAEFLALHGVAQILKTISEVIQTGINKNLKIEGVLITMLDTRTNLGSTVQENIIRTFGNNVYKVSIPRASKIAVAANYGQPIYEYDEKSVGASKYLEFVKEVLQRNVKKESE